MSLLSEAVSDDLLDTILNIEAQAAVAAESAKGEGAGDTSDLVLLARAALGAVCAGNLIRS